MGLSGAWLWPKVSQRRFAQNAIQEAFWATIFVAAMTAILTTVLLFAPDDGSDFATIGFVTAAVFGALAFGIYRRSRLAALLTFALFVGGTIFQFVIHGPGGWLYRGLVALALLHGVRGTIAYHKLPPLPVNLPSLEQSFQAFKDGPSEQKQD